jgi:hypothetical protein
VAKQLYYRDSEGAYRVYAPQERRGGGGVTGVLMTICVILMIVLFGTLLLERFGVPNPLAPPESAPTALPTLAPPTALPTLAPPTARPVVAPRVEIPGPPAPIPTAAPVEVEIPAPQPLVLPTPRFDAPNSLDKRTVRVVAPEAERGALSVEPTPKGNEKGSLRKGGGERAP